MNTSIYHRIGHEWCDHLKGLMWGQEDARPLRTAKVLHVRELILIDFILYVELAGDSILFFQTP